MNRKELLNTLAQKFPDFRKKDLELILELLFQHLAQTLKEGRRIEIRGFGRFYVKEQRGRRFKNPRTGEERNLPPRKRIIFKPGKDLRERLNEKAYASLDLGTQTFRLLVGKPQAGGFRPLLKERFNVRLGEDLNQGHISPQAFSRGLETLHKIREILEKIEVNDVFAAGTAVFRKAKNASEFIERAAEETGIKIQVLSPEEEATFTLKGVLSGLKKDFEDPVLIVDAGGGSTEFILGSQERVLALGSLDIGAVTLTAKHLAGEEIPSQESLSALQKEIEKHLLPLKSLPAPPTSLIATGGTASCLASLKLGLETYCPEKIHGQKITRKELEELFDKLRRLTPEERRNLKGMEPGREDIILAGLMIYLKILESLSSVKDLTVSETGILEGLLLHLLQENPIISANN